jgi:NAD(P)-dependent dehydrogenase (short-subunit alcohol dehydrogenase family)
MSTNISRALIVGGTSGIGYGIACRVASEAKSSTVIISGRTEPPQLPHANIEFRRLDASSMRAIKAYADAYKAEQEPRIDLLVLSQGLMSTAGRTETPDEGIDRKMALHYYGRQLLVRELLPVLAEDAKVVFVLDALRGDPAKLDWDDLDLKTTYGVVRAADHCISMTDAMVQHFAAQQKSTGGRRHFVHVYPGIVRSGLGRELPWYLRGPMQALGHVLGVAPEVSGERLFRGAYDCAALSEQHGRFWSFVEAKGRPVPDKAAWGEEQVAKVAAHTWKIVDDACAV